VPFGTVRPGTKTRATMRMMPMGIIELNIKRNVELTVSCSVTGKLSEHTVS
jgi:hypothetical protein